jgi:hypothetical protein
VALVRVEARRSRDRHIISALIERKHDELVHDAMLRRRVGQREEEEDDDDDDEEEEEEEEEERR